MIPLKPILALATLTVGTLAFAKPTMVGVRANNTVFRFNPQTGVSEDIGTMPGLSIANGCAMNPSGVLYACSFIAPRKFARIDVGNGSTAIINATFDDIRDLAFIGNDLYGIREGGANDTLVLINENSGFVSSIGATGDGALQGLASLPDGRLFGWSLTRGLMTLNTTTGLATDVNVGVVGPALQSLSFDQDGVLFGADTSGAVYKVNPADGTTTLASNVGGDVRGVAALPRSHRLLLMPGVASTLGPQILDTGTMERTPLPGSSGINLGGSWGAGGTTFFQSGSTLTRRNPGNGSPSNIGIDGGMRALAFDGTTLFGILNGGIDQLVTINQATGASTLVGNTGMTTIEGLADVNGTLFGWDTAVGLVIINKATGAATDASTRFGGTAAIGCLESAPDGTLYGVGDKLYVINASTGGFVPRGGDWADSIGGSAYVSDIGRMIAVTNQAGGRVLSDRLGNHTGLGWVLPHVCRGIGFADDGFTYAAMELGGNDQLFRLDPSTGSLTAFGTNTLDDPRSITSDEGDLLVGTGDDLQRYDYATNGYSFAASGIFNYQRVVRTSEGRFLGADLAITGGFYRVDKPGFVQSTILATPPPYAPFAIYPDGMLVGANTDWFVIDPLTGATVVYGLTDQFFAMAYVGGQMSADVNLQDYMGDPRSQVITFEIRHRGSSNPIETRSVRASAAGPITVAILQNGAYDVAIKGPHWLRKVLSPSNVTNGTVLAAVSLVNGDCDGDNEIGIGDYGMISAAYNSSLGDPTFEPNADLNGDDAVDIADFAIMSANYGTIGDD